MQSAQISLIDARQGAVRMFEEILGDDHGALREAGIPKLGLPQLPKDPLVVVHREDRILYGRSIHTLLFRG